jgi:hypothetical protein
MHTKRGCNELGFLQRIHCALRLGDGSWLCCESLTAWRSWLYRQMGTCRPPACHVAWFPCYAALACLVANLAVTVVFTWLFNITHAARRSDSTANVDYQEVAP